MKTNPKCGLLGTASEIWVNDTPSGRGHNHPTGNAELQTFLLSNNPFVHSSIMMRREAIETCGLYTTDPERQPPEDYELWSRISRRYQVRNLPERLVAYREVTGSLSRDPGELFHQRVLLISAENIAFWNEMDVPDANCFSSAALLNAAYAQVPQDVNISSIMHLLTNAVRRITESYPGEDLAATEKKLLAHVLRRFEVAHPLSRSGKTILTAARKLQVPMELRQRLAAWVSS